MKKLTFILLVVVLILGVSNAAKAGTVHKCFWIWSTAVTTANDKPDYIYCDWDGNNKYVAVAASDTSKYIQDTKGAVKVSVAWDSLYADGVNTVGGLHGSITNATVLTSSAGTNWDINILGCAFDGTCDTGTGTLAYWQDDDHSTNEKNSWTLTPLARGFRITVDGDTGNNSPVIRTIVVW